MSTELIFVGELRITETMWELLLPVLILYPDVLQFYYRFTDDVLSLVTEAKLTILLFQHLLHCSWLHYAR